MEKKRIVVDTTAIISYFSSIFNRKTQLSRRALNIMRDAFEQEDKVIMIIPSVVFIEIFDKWFLGSTYADEEFRAKLLAEVIYPIYSVTNIEMREIDDEVVEEFLSLYDKDMKLEQHDRLILASAIVLDACLITSDGELISFQKKYSQPPSIVT